MASVKRRNRLTSHAMSSANASAPISWVRLLGFGLVFLALSALVPYLIYRELEGDWLILDTRLWRWQVAAALVALLLVYFVTDGLRLWCVVRALGYPLPPGQMAPLVFLNILVSNITPLASGGGFAQIWYLRRLGVPVGAATAATTLRTLLASAGIFVPALLMLWLWPALAANTIGGRWFYLLGALAVLYFGFFALLLSQLGVLLALVKRLLGVATRWQWLSAERANHWYRVLRHEMLRFVLALRGFLRAPGRYVWLSLVATAAFLITLFSVPAVLLWALGYDVPWLTTLGLSTVTTFVMYFAPTPGAAGAAEGMFSLLFRGYVSTGDLLLLVVAWRFLSIHLGMLLGIPVLLFAMMRRPAHAS